MTADCVGGVWTYATTLCRVLAAHDVQVLLAVTGGELSDIQRHEARSLSNVDLRHRPYKCEWMDNPGADVEAAGNWLCDLLADREFDVVHLNDFAHAAQPGWPSKIVVAHSDVCSWFHHVRSDVAPARFEVYRQKVIEGLLHAEAVVAPTMAVLDDLRQHYGHVTGEALVIPNAVAPVKISSQARSPFILAAGRLWDEAKNIAALATAAPDLEWPVVVAGEADHPDGGTCRFENVQLAGPLSQPRLFELMSEAAIYALPARYEPFGLSAAEAAMRGCALVLGDIPSLREVWGDAALFVPPDDADALAHVLQRLITNPDLREHYSRSAHARVQTYSPARQGRAYLELYQRHAVSRLIGASS